MYLKSEASDYHFYESCTDPYTNPIERRPEDEQEKTI